MASTATKITFFILIIGIDLKAAAMEVPRSRRQFRGNPDECRYRAAGAQGDLCRDW
jgi:hypothetical protein